MNGRRRRDRCPRRTRARARNAGEQVVLELVVRLRRIDVRQRARAGSVRVTSQRNGRITLATVHRPILYASVVSTASTRPLYGRGRGSNPRGGSSDARSSVDGAPPCEGGGRWFYSSRAFPTKACGVAEARRAPTSSGSSPARSRRSSRPRSSCSRAAARRDSRPYGPSGHDRPLRREPRAPRLPHHHPSRGCGGIGIRTGLRSRRPQAMRVRLPPSASEKRGFAHGIRRARRARATILRATVGSTVHGLHHGGQDDRDEMAVYIEPPEYLIGLARARGIRAGSTASSTTSSGRNPKACAQGPAISIRSPTACGSTSGSC